MRTKVSCSVWSRGKIVGLAGNAEAEIYLLLSINMVPDEIWNKHGIYPVSSGIEDIVVNQDETLCTGDEGHEETEDEVA